MECTLYHASVESFTEFKEEKITRNETDLMTNGFWFSSDKNTSCAWRNPKYLKTCKITLNNPVTYDTMKEIYNELGGRFECSCNDLRLELLKRGYDGFIMHDKFNLPLDYFDNNEEYIFTGPKGGKYKLIKSEFAGYYELYSVNKYGVEEFETDYASIEEFNNQEVVVCVFSSKSIEILKEEDNIYWR